MADGPRKLFISYARADRPKVAPLAAALAARGHTVWWDQLIDGGTAFAKEIETQLNNADAVVVAWSATSIQSDWVRDEAATGRDRKCLVPVSLDGSLPPLGFRQYHTIDLSKWRGRGEGAAFDALLRAIGVSEGVPDVPAKRFAEERGITRRTAVIIGAGTVALAAGGYGAWRSLEPTPRSGDSVAVIPFANLSDDPKQAYFSDGLSEEVRSALARNVRIKVAAPTSSARFRDSKEDARSIGGQLGVAFLLQGSVRRAGDTVRVAAELVDTGTGFSAWSQSFDRKLSDIFAVQSEIAGTVARALDGAMSVAAPAPVGGTRNVAAYEAYLRGRALLDQATSEATDRGALAQFEAATAADPEYAAARAALSRALIVIAQQWARGAASAPLIDRGIVEARRAAELDPELADAQSALAFALAYGKLDIRAARGPFERARVLGQGDADVLIRYAQFATRTGDFATAAAAVDRIVALDPLNPRAYRTRAALFYSQKRYAESIAPGEKALSLNPKLNVANAAIGDALYLLGQPTDALARYRAEPSPTFRLPGLAMGLHRMKDERGAEFAMAELVSTLGDSAAYQQAQVRAQWGQPDAALAMLDRALSARDAGLLYLRNDPMLDSLRGNPRFGVLTQALGFG